MKLLKELKWGMIISSVALVILGIILFVWPEATMNVICYILAGLLLILGVGFLINYIRQDIHRILYRHDLVFGVSAILGGILIFIKVEQLTNLIPVVLGFLVTISGILKLQNSVDLFRLGYGTWHVAFAFAIINVVVGVILLIDPFAKEILIMAIGISLIYSGITDLYVTIAIALKLRHEQKNSEKEADADNREVLIYEQMDDADQR